MTSLSAAFDEATTAKGNPSVSQETPYANPHIPRYEDNTLDEADKRYAYERSRQKLYAKAPPHHNGHRPTMSSQESFKEMRPGEYDKRDAPRHEKAHVSCSSCQQDMSCGAENNVFCSSCNRQSLESPATPIPSLFR